MAVRPRIEELIDARAEFAKLVKAKRIGFQKKQAELWRFLKTLVSQWFLLGASVAP